MASSDLGLPEGVIIRGSGSSGPPPPPRNGLANIVVSDFPLNPDPFEWQEPKRLDELYNFPTTTPSIPTTIEPPASVDYSPAPVPEPEPEPLPEPTPEPEESAKRLRADTPGVLRFLLGLVGLIAAASFIVSFSGLYAAAEWAVGPVPWLQVAVPVMLDVAIIAFTAVLFVERERRERIVGTWLAIGVFATVSAVANVLHTLAITTAATPAQVIVGCIISGGAPLLLAFTTDKIAVKVFKSPKES